MSAPALEVTSEVAYDLLQDHMETILALLDQPLSRGEVLSRVGSPAVLDRMLRQGLVQPDGNSIRAVAGVYHQLRQEGMLSFLSRYVLPTLTANVDGEGTPYASLAARYVALDGSRARGLRQGPVQHLFEELGAVSDQPATGPVARLTVLVVGTSRIVRAHLPEDEAALAHAKNASLQRSTPAERELAVLSQGDFLADEGRFTAARDLVTRFVAGLDADATTPSEATYHLTVASLWHSPGPQDRPTH